MILAALTVAACTDEPDEKLSSDSHGVLVDNRISANRISANRISANRISANRISANRISSNSWDANEAAMGDLLDTPEGQELLAFLIGCALPEGDVLIADDPNGGPPIEFFGEIGIASEWVNRPLDASDKRWVTACILSRVNNNNVSVEISMRGPHAVLASTAGELASHTVEEGAFYGNIFGPLNHPLEWYACRGEAQAAGETGGLADRDCAEPDPANKGYTYCGFIYTGDCADFDEPRNKYACASFSADGYYENCETKARPNFNHLHAKMKSHKGYHEVITTFLVP